MLIEALEEKQIEVISANTDGILVKLHNNKKDTFKQICKEWEKHTQFNLEYNQFVKYARRDVNNYTALTNENKIKNKGIFTPPDLKHDVQAPVIQKMARSHLLYGTDITDYLEENREDLSVYDFLFSFSATKVYEVSLMHGVIPCQKMNYMHVT